VEARDEACTACFMRIPPQMYIEVIRRSKVLQCPNCHRILIPPAAEGPE
jgi:predicted  nucleic acid-binding Zn-ribbon protein